jgi:hypothetical protein
MRALTVKWPWNSAIAYGTKRIENRSNPIPPNHVGTDICLHAGASEDRTPRPSHQLPRILTDNLTVWPHHQKAILAVVTLTGCHEDTGCCRPWGFESPWHWELANVRPLPEPILGVGGQLGLWTVPNDVLTAVQRQVRLDTAA